MASEDEQQDQHKDRSIWDFIPKPNLSFGGLFSMAFWGVIFAGIAYFVLKYTGLGDQLPEKWKTGIESFLTSINPKLSLFPNASVAHYLEDMPAHAGKQGEDNAYDTLMGQDIGKQQPALVKLLTADDATWKSFVRTVSSANNGVITTDGSTFLNRQSIFALLTKQPALARQIIAAVTIPPPSADGTPNPMIAQLLGSITDIAKDRSQFTQLFKGESFDATIEALAKFAPTMMPQGGPAISIDAEALKQFVRATGLDASGNPTDTLYTFVQQSLSGNSAALVSYITDPAVLANPGAVSTLMQGMTITAAGNSDNSLGGFVALLRSPQNVQAFSTMLTQLGPDKAQALMQLVGDPSNGPRIADMITSDPQMLTAIKQFADSAASTINLSTLPSSALTSIITSVHDHSINEIKTGLELQKQHIDPAKVQATIAATFPIKQGSKEVDWGQAVPALLDPNNSGTLLATLNALVKTDPQQAQAMLQTQVPGLSLETATSLLAFVNRLGRNPDNHTDAAAQAGMEDVITAMTGVLVKAPHDFSLLTQLSPDEVAHFFQSPENTQAFYCLLIQMDENPSLKLSERDHALVSVMRHQWLRHDSQDNLYGISQILGDPKGAAFLLKHLAPNKPGLVGNIVNETVKHPVLAGASFGAIPYNIGWAKTLVPGLGDWMDIQGTPVLKQNEGSLMAVKAVLDQYNQPQNGIRYDADVSHGDTAVMVPMPAAAMPPARVTNQKR